MHSIDDRIIKASFRGNNPEERKEFRQSTCLMPISVGQAIHEGNKFKAVIKLINSSFKHCTILVDDSVQRHTMGITNKLDNDSLYKLANAEGESWLARNKLSYDELTIPYDILRWDHWLHNKNFANSHELVKYQYYENSVYKAAIDANIDEFLSRHLKNFQHIKIDMQRAYRLCLDYLLEECAVMCLWVDGAYDFEVYPSGRNLAMAATYEQLIKPKMTNYLRPVALRFKKYPGYNPSNAKTDNISSLVNCHLDQTKSLHPDNISVE